MDRFLIAPYDKDSGLQTNVKPWLVPDEAFAQLENAYVFRGRVRKRFGSRWLGDTQVSTRLRIALKDNLGNPVVTNGAGNAADTVPGGVGAVGQIFSIGTVVYTVYALGASPLLSSGIGAGTFDTATGAYTFAGAPANTQVYWYPSLPVMGLLSREENAVNDEPVVGFDTRFAYQYSGTGWERLDGETNPGDASWTGDNAEFFWGTTWTGADAFTKVFFVTNFNESEPNYMRYFLSGNWNTFRPLLTSVTVGGTTTTTNLDMARIIVPFKNRLVCFNTWESETTVTPPAPPVITQQNNYVNRCRYSQIGSPIPTGPDFFEWRQDVPGRGNAIDAPTTEAIITVEFVKDRLIVFFERSTWELVYTGNQAYPFAWQQINTELGAESTFSVVPFDKVAIGVGNVGIHACNGTNVDRIDSKIPDKVFDIHNVDGGVFRVYGIRDYYTEMIYWTFPSVDQTNTDPYPNRILVYNYATGTWAFNDDSITAFGYFQPTQGVLWSSTTVSWGDSVPWGAGSLQAKFRQVVAGNQEGYTFIVDSDETTNAPALQITNMAIAANVITLTVINHNMRQGEFIYLQDIVGTGNLNLLNDAIFEIVTVTDANTIVINFNDGAGTIIAGVYAGNGVIARVSKINILTKEYNFYGDKGRNIYVQKVDFMVDRTDGGALEVDYFVSTSVDPLLADSVLTDALLGTGTLETSAYATVPFEANATRVVHPCYLQADGEFIQLQLTMSPTQMVSTAVRDADFQMHYMLFWTIPSSMRPQ